MSVQDSVNQHMHVGRKMIEAGQVKEFENHTEVEAIFVQSVMIDHRLAELTEAVIELTEMMQKVGSVIEDR
jgi:hypothetical protein